MRIIRPNTFGYGKKKGPTGPFLFNKSKKMPTQQARPASFAMA
jgi:hypothetical protein